MEVQHRVTQEIKSKNLNLESQTIEPILSVTTVYLGFSALGVAVATEPAF
jgi:hypothetical protein